MKGYTTARAQDENGAAKTGLLFPLPLTHGLVPCRVELVKRRRHCVLIAASAMLLVL
jgi:hypothetical protein